MSEDHVPEEAGSLIPQRVAEIRRFHQCMYNADAQPADMLGFFDDNAIIRQIDGVALEGHAQIKDYFRRRMPSHRTARSFRCFPRNPFSVGEPIVYAQSNAIKVRMTECWCFSGITHVFYFAKDSTAITYMVNE